MTMLTYDQALDIILNSAWPLLPESISVRESCGRVLRGDIYSWIDLPPFNNSQMDGYALFSVDTDRASSDSPVVLSVIGEIQAGAALNSLELGPGQCVRIFTGACLPPNANCVVPQEDVRIREDGWIEIGSPIAPSEFVRFRGDDARHGDNILRSGTEIRPYEISLISAVGLDTVNVGKVPSVAIISNGNELIEPGTALAKLARGQIFNSNGIALSSQVQQAGGKVISEITVEDNHAQIEIALKNALESDVDILIACGGVSVGRYDLVRPAAESLGVKFDFTQLAIRPGKPTTFGHIGKTAFFGLPGNPVSAMVTFELFVRPLIRRLQGYPVELCSRPTFDGILDTPASHGKGRRTFSRATVSFVDGMVRVRPSDAQRSDQISGIASADALFILPEDVAELPAESKVKVMLID